MDDAEALGTHIAAQYNAIAEILELLYETPGVSKERVKEIGDRLETTSDKAIVASRR